MSRTSVSRTFASEFTVNPTLYIRSCPLLPRDSSSTFLFQSLFYLSLLRTRIFIIHRATRPRGIDRAYLLAESSHGLARARRSSLVASRRDQASRRSHVELRCGCRPSGTLPPYRARNRPPTERRRSVRPIAKAPLMSRANDVLHSYSCSRVRDHSVL